MGGILHQILCSPPNFEIQTCSNLQNVNSKISKTKISKKRQIGLGAETFVQVK